MVSRFSFGEYVLPVCPTVLVPYLRTVTVRALQLQVRTDEGEQHTSNIISILARIKVLGIEARAGAGTLGSLLAIVYFC